MAPTDKEIEEAIYLFVMLAAAASLYRGQLQLLVAFREKKSCSSLLYIDSFSRRAATKSRDPDISFLR